MKRVAIVGAEASKFTKPAEEAARALIRLLLCGATHVVSGHCHLGGIDIWAEEEADSLKIDKLIFPPKVYAWEGYRARNIQIVNHCDELYNITVASLPSTYQGMRFRSCYHCRTTKHIKSGGCWTAKWAQKSGKPAHWHVINQDGSVSE